MFFYPCPSRPCPSAGPTGRIRSVLILSSLLPLCLQPTNALHTGPVNSTSTSTNTDAEHTSRPSSTSSALPPIVVICIVATGVFLVALGSISLFLYLRRLRERTKRLEHREKAWQFKDMHRNGHGLRLGPTPLDLKTEGGGDGGGGDNKNTATPGVQISEPVLMTEATSSPRYPTRAFRW